MTPLPSRWVQPSAEDAVRCDPADVFAAGTRNHHISNTAYPIAHESTWAPYRKTRDAHDAAVADAFKDVSDLCLYVHIPFCEVRCSFCEYTVVSGADLDNTAGYRDALIAEIKRYGQRLNDKHRPIRGIDIGGGTPAFMDADDMEAIVAALRQSFDVGDAGISIETTPRLAAKDATKLKRYVEMGIERMSMGVQVIQPDLLKVLERDGNGVEHHHRAMDHMRAAGCDRVNLDVMYGFADQTESSLEATLKHCIALKPEYITLYRMRYKLTRISHQASRVTLEHAKAHARLCREVLESAGFEANPGKNTFVHRRVRKVSRSDVGTSDYLTERVIKGTPYLGVGLGAQTFTHTTISYNDGSVGKNLAPYLRSVAEGRLPIQDLYVLPAVQMMAKFVAVAFYFGEIDRPSFRKKFGVDVDVAFADEVAWVKGKGLMHDTSGQSGRSDALSLTAEGAANFAGVIALFFAPSVQRTLLSRDPETATDMETAKQRALKVLQRSA
jgi:oxygen-independent coproporphyrinogen-3 oxidase